MQKMLWSWLFLLGIALLPTHAQDTLTFNEPITVTLQAEAPVELTFIGQAGQMINLVTYTSGENPPDSTLTLIAPNGLVLAYHDDTRIGEEVDSNATLTHILLLSAGEYTLQVDSFNGVSEGDVTVVMSEVAPFNVLESDETSTRLQADLRVGSTFVYALPSSNTPQTLQITVKDISNSLDPFIRIRNADGEIITTVDDTPNFAELLNLFDSRVSIEIPANTNYTLEVIDFLGRSGQVEIHIQAE
jgi:hypothetical protein